MVEGVETGDVRFTPESGHVRVQLEMSAKGQERTSISRFGRPSYTVIGSVNFANGFAKT